MIKSRMTCLLASLFMAGTVLATTPEAALKTVEGVAHKAEQVAQANAHDLRSVVGDAVGSVKGLNVKKTQLENEITDLKARLEALKAENDALVAQGEAQAGARRNLEGAVRLYTGTTLDRLKKVTYATDKDLAIDTLQGIKSAQSFPSLNEVRALANTLAAERDLASTIERRPMDVFTPSGDKETLDVFRVGGFEAVAFTNNRPYFLLPEANGTRLVRFEKLPSRDDATAMENFLKGTSSLLPLDLSFGRVIRDAADDTSLLAHLEAGGRLVWVILGLGLICLLVGLYAWVKLLLVKAPNTDALNKTFDALKNGDVDGALTTLKASSPSPERDVIAHMLTFGGKTTDGLDTALDEAEALYVSPLNRGAALVAFGAAVAPLLGLLGTVTGMIATFDVITLFGNGDPKLLSGGISVALVTTETGLVVAILLMMLHFAITRRFNTLRERCDEAAAKALARAAVGVAP